MHRHPIVRIIPFLFCLFSGVFAVQAQETGRAVFTPESKRWEILIDGAVRSESNADVRAPGAKSQQSTSASTPLTAVEKLDYSLRLAFANPFAYVSPAFGAFLTERRDVKRPGKTGGDKFADGLSYYARDFATNSSMILFGSGIYPVLFKQDPRYKPSHRRGFVTRAAYAASRTLVIDSDKGEKQFNASYLLGNLTGAALANLYERDPVRARDTQGRPIAFYSHVGVGPTLATFGISTALGAVTNIAFNEFDVIGKLRKLLHK